MRSYTLGVVRRFVSSGTRDDAMRFTVTPVTLPATRVTTMTKASPGASPTETKGSAGMLMAWPSKKTMPARLPPA